MDVGLSEGENVVHRYRCTAHEGCTSLLGSVMPFGIGASSGTECTITVTDSRVMCDTGGDGKRMPRHQGVELSRISSVYSLIGRFTVSATLPLVLIIVSLVLMVAPLAYAYGTGAVDTVGDYTDGYNDGVRYGYYTTYLDAIEGGKTNTIPSGFEADYDRYGSEDYYKGFDDGKKAGSERATKDLTSSKAFSVPTGLYKSDSITTISLVCCIIGAVLFIFAAMVMTAGKKVGNWIAISLDGSKSILVSGLVDEFEGIDFGDDVDFALMELGAVIMDAKAGIFDDGDERMMIGSGYA